MSLTDRFQAYADAFEETYADDDWSRLEPFFTEDAVYDVITDPPFAGTYEGRDAVFAQLKQSLDSFDRKFDTRTLELTATPAEGSGEVTIQWAVTYTKAGAPDIRMEGSERAVFDGDRIKRLEDRFADGTVPSIMAWMGDHGARLG